MMTIEIDGRRVQAEGGTILEAALGAGVQIPHFCYHKKLSIAANCRMCLVEVEKAPKPVPACATAIADGMKVFTHSPLIKKAQEAILEFLLINHPLDCPVCDQGGECRLQDLAFAFGATKSRFLEPKRVVSPKEAGPLISMREMSRCIHCARCVRFGQEIAGIMELGMTGRGGDVEVQTFMGRSIDSELSGNLIDVCPVGALTSKPFRHTARAWELTPRRSISPHDSFGSNLTLHVKDNRVLRTVPDENDEINECWLSDKDRFSYEALSSAGRLTQPMIRVDGRLRETSWNVALDYAAHAIKDITARHGASALASLASPHATLEELYLLQKLTRALGSENIDFRPRRRDFSTDGRRAGIPWLGLRIADIAALDTVLVVGASLRTDHPLLAQRLRQLAKKTAKISLVSALGDDPRIDLHARLTLRPDDFVPALSALADRLAMAKGLRRERSAPSSAFSDAALAALHAIADSLADGKNIALFLGNAVEHSPFAGKLHALAAELARLCGARFGFIGEAANSVGGYLARACPGSGGLSAYDMFREPRKAYLLHGVEPGLDCHNPRLALAALGAADAVIAVTPFFDPSSEYADVLLPAAPFSETSGAFVNLEGRIQRFSGACRPAGEARPAWKIFRALGGLLELRGFDYDSSEDVLREMVPPDRRFADGLSNALDGENEVGAAEASIDRGLRRIAEVPAYFADPLVRRAASLQKTPDAAPPEARMSAATLSDLSIGDGERVRVTQDEGTAILTARLDNDVPEACARVAAAHPLTANLGDMFGAIHLERVQ